MSFAFSTHTLSRCCSMYCFHPPGCPTYGNNTLYSQWKYCSWIFALLTSSCTVTSWLPLCFMCEITAPWDCTEKKPITQQMSTFSSEVVRFFFSPRLSSISPLCCFSSAGRQKEVRATEVLFGYLFMDFAFNIHAFFRTIWVQRRICCLGGGRGQK